MSRRTVLVSVMILPALALARDAPAPDSPAPPPAVRFMGIEDVKATRVAFVCDGSRWAETKDEELVAELLRAIKPLAASQSVSVFFFADDKAWGPNDGKPLPASDENKATLRAWFDERMKLGRDSTPAAGLKLAFEGKPDTLFFVSDGNFEGYDDLARLVATLNPDRAVKVHAVGYFLNENEDDSRQFIQFMKQLAEGNGGQFKLAYAEEMDRHTE